MFFKVYLVDGAEKSLFSLDNLLKSIMSISKGKQITNCWILEMKKENSL